MKLTIDKIGLLRKTFKSKKYQETYLVRVDSFVISYRFIEEDRVFINAVKHMKQR